MTWQSPDPRTSSDREAQRTRRSAALSPAGAERTVKSARPAFGGWNIDMRRHRRGRTRARACAWSTVTSAPLESQEQAVSVRVADPQELLIGEVSTGRLPQRDQSACARGQFTANENSSAREIGRCREELTYGPPGGEGFNAVRHRVRARSGIQPTRVRIRWSRKGQLVVVEGRGVARIAAQLADLERLATQVKAL